MNEAKMPSVLKHFPGYGNNTDTHTGIAQDNRPLESFYASDFLPFKAGIEADCLSILVSHNIVSSMDEQYPASLSSNVHHILREDLGFKGVIMTDDLGMDAIKLYTQGQNPAVQAVIAGNDILLTSDIQGSFSAILPRLWRKKRFRKSALPIGSAHFGDEICLRHYQIMHKALYKLFSLQRAL